MKSGSSPVSPSALHQSTALHPAPWAVVPTLYIIL
jgi:hypothetical protein